MLPKIPLHVSVCPARILRCFFIVQITAAQITRAMIPAGGDKQFMEMVERQDLDMVILFYNPVKIGRAHV